MNKKAVNTAENIPKLKIRYDTESNYSSDNPLLSHPVLAAQVEKRKCAFNQS